MGNQKIENNPYINKDTDERSIKYQETSNVNETSLSFKQLIKDAAKQAVKAIKWLFITLITFSVLNIIFLLITIFGKQQTDKLSTALVFIIGLVVIVYALSKTYKYVLIDALSTAYKYLTPLFKKIAVKIIDTVIAGGNMITGKDINKSLNVGSLMLEIYGKKAPKYVQKGIQLVLNIIPFNSFLISMQKELSEKKDNKTLSEILYKYMDSYIVNSIFKENTMKWMIWLLIANILVQTGIIILL